MWAIILYKLPRLKVYCWLFPAGTSLLLQLFVSVVDVCIFSGFGDGEAVGVVWIFGCDVGVWCKGGSLIISCLIKCAASAGLIIEPNRFACIFAWDNNIEAWALGVNGIGIGLSRLRFLRSESQGPGCPGCL